MFIYTYQSARFFIALIGGLYLMFLPIMAKANIILNEIMYDPNGTDTGREWVEVYNQGDDDVDLALYKIFENNINHKLTLHASSTFSILEKQRYAIIADNAEKFLQDYPDFDGLLFDSAFSLNNSGEVISIIDQGGAVTSEFTYNPDIGAGNNGNSLQITDLGVWIEARPNPGAKNSQTAEPATDSSSSDNTSSVASSTSSHSGQNNLTKYKELFELEIGAGRDRLVSINTPIQFKAEHNANQKPKFFWTVGDGNILSGSKIEHYYRRPGTYNVVLNGLWNGYQATSRITVTATLPKINLDIATSTVIDDQIVKNAFDILLNNQSNTEINFGEFNLSFLGKEYSIPADTIVSPQTQIVIPAEYTDFMAPTSTTSSTTLLMQYPNGRPFLEKVIKLIPSI